MNGSNIIALVVLLNGLDPLKGLSAKLQKCDADIVAAYKNTASSAEDIQSQRETFDTVWEQWFKEAERITEDNGSEIKPPRTYEHDLVKNNWRRVTCQQMSSYNAVNLCL